MPKQRDSRILGALENFVSSKGEPSESLEVRVANLEQTLRLVLSEIADIHIRLDRPQNTPKANVSNGTPKHSQAKPKQSPLPKQTVEADGLHADAIDCHPSGDQSDGPSQLCEDEDAFIRWYPSHAGRDTPRDSGFQ